jgi:endonuclease/exonuclease/phosphatase family metal-dependent hydrolase
VIGLRPVPTPTIPRSARRNRAAGVLALVLATVAALAAAPRAQAAPAPVEVRVMTFNIWLGGDVVDLGGVIAAIRDARADIVGLQEAEGNTQRIAAELGWPYWSDRLHVVSRYPLIDLPSAHGEYVLAQVRPGEVFALANVHLTSDPYGPYAVRAGRSLTRVLALERRTRLPEIRATLAAVRPAVARGIPAFITGDFNTPSHLDWTPAVAAVRPDVRYPVPWPVTEAVARAGFQDTYRVVHPDPVATPGITWTFGYPFPRRAADEVIDRIDFVHASAGVQVLDSGIAGPGGTPDATFPVDPYPSDHRAVVSDVRLVPGAPPSFASVLQRRVVRGDRVGVRYAAPRGEGVDRLAIVHAGGRPSAALMTLPPQEASFFGAVTFGSGGLAPGRYDALLVTRRDRVLSRSTFWVVRRRAQPSVHVPRTVRAGHAIRISWRNAPAMRRDWVGIWKVGDNDLYNDYLTFAYTGATVAGATRIAGDAKTFPPGRYVARLLLDDGYAQLARASSG